MKPQRLLNICFWLLFTIAVLILARTGRRVFVGDWFPVNTTSMTPTIIPGDKIWVNKLIFGARIYKNFDFFSGKPMESFRVWGWRKIRRGDVVVFNAPIQVSKSDSIAFKIDYVFVKRCVGLPGDTVRVHRHTRQFHLQDSLHSVNRQKYSGAVYVPKKGDTIYMSQSNIDLYQRVIAYETSDNLPTVFHVFQNNYYFMCGDNTLQSYDSRYFGFVPEEFIIGVSKRVLFNNRDGWKQKLTGRRVLKQL